MKKKESNISQKQNDETALNDYFKLLAKFNIFSKEERAKKKLYRLIFKNN
jgi:hypothetical protein